MQFKHPEILYALALLIIPIIVHLFQLRRYKKTPFTNVKMLQKLMQHSRKSKRLKKGLILATRLLALACIIFAFSQPYISKDKKNKPTKFSIYLDNSWSMQAKGVGGELLKFNTSQLIENASLFNYPVKLYSNSDFYENESLENLKNELNTLNYTANKIDLNTEFSNKNNYTNNLEEVVLVSDFQNNNIFNTTDFTNVNTNYSYIKTQPTTQNNFFIDSVYITNNSPEEIFINITVKSNTETSENIPISLYNENELVGKSMIKFEASNKELATFKTDIKDSFKGKITITEKWLPFDNEFYFSIHKRAKIKVLNIGKDAAFLTKIFTQKEFDYTSVNLKYLNFNNLLKQQLIILNELDEIPPSLITVLKEHHSNGGKLIIIPNNSIELNSYNNLLNELTNAKIKTQLEGIYKITEIHFDHPLLKGVFEKQISNFQYPTTNTLYAVSNNFSAIISTQNKIPFIAASKNVYWVASPLNNNTTNFKNSPLIVPVFYNIGQLNQNNNTYYYTIKEDLEINIPTKIKTNEVLQIQHYLSDEKYIPLQIVKPNYVTLNLENLNLKQGWYNIWKNDEVITTLALNYNRDESVLNYIDIENLTSQNSNVTFYDSIEGFTKNFIADYKINWLFKWFLALSVLFLLLEILILKYFNI